MLVSRWGVERLEQRRHVWMWDGDSSDVCQWPRCSQLSIGPHWGFLLPLGLENSLQYKGRSATGSHTAVWRSSRKVVMVQRTLWWSPKDTSSTSFFIKQLYWWIQISSCFPIWLYWSSVLSFSQCDANFELCNYGYTWAADHKPSPPASTRFLPINIVLTELVPIWDKQHLMHKSHSETAWLSIGATLPSLTSSGRLLAPNSIILFAICKLW